MANIKTTPKQWILAKEYYEAGLSLSNIVEKTGISKTQLSKKSNLEGWKKEFEKEHLIQDAVRVSIAKGTLTEQALLIHNEIVDERTKHIQFFTNITVKNINAMESKLNNELSIVEHKHAQETIAKAKETVLGRESNTQVNIQNNTTINNDVVAGAKDLLLQRLAKLNEPRIIESQ